MKVKSVQGISPLGFHKIAYTEWGEESADRTVVCVHGLTRNGRDFDWLAKDLSASWRVVCPDMVGRGESDWLAGGAASYTFPQYINDCTALIARLNVDKIDWVGTSMGGLIGMMMAALPHSPIKRLVINDVGPFIPQEVINGIITYAQQAPSFPNLTAAKDYISSLYRGFIADDNPNFWQHLTIYGTFRKNDGLFYLKRDPQVVYGLPGGVVSNVDLWAYWDTIKCPLLVIRGANSTLLTPKILQEMKMRKPEITVVELAGMGHAPSLSTPQEIDLVARWLREAPEVC